MILEVTQIDEKKTQRGKGYNLVNGTYYDWNKLITTPGSYEVTIDKSDKWPKIKSATPATKVTTTPTTSNNDTSSSNSTPNSNSSFYALRDKMMILSYAKDLTIALLKDNDNSDIKKTGQTLAFFYTILPLITNEDIRLNKKIKDIHKLAQLTQQLINELDTNESQANNVVEMVKKTFEGEEVKNEKKETKETKESEEVEEPEKENNF